MKQIIFAFLLTASSALAEPERPPCDDAGPDTTFCAGATFARVDEGQTQGLSFWMHRDGYLSKVLVQRVPEERVDGAEIEAQIIAMVSQQAQDIGRSFAFSDLKSASVDGATFGTLSYKLSKAEKENAILHSYVAIRGKVLQVISQIALKRASPDPAALERAHAAALDAITLTQAGHDA